MGELSKRPRPRGGGGDLGAAGGGRRLEETEVHEVPARLASQGLSAQNPGASGHQGAHRHGAVIPTLA